MRKSHWRKILTSFVLATLLLVTTACANSEPPSRFEQAQQESSQRGATAVAKDAEAGGSFNKFFPQASGDHSLVYTQEKKGFAAAKLKKDGQELASMTISDTSSNPSAKEKYQQATEEIAGYPTVQQGSKGTGLLVADRFQVKILSKDDSFTKSDRADWLSKFDLRGLETLK